MWQETSSNEDREWVARCKDGDESAFEPLVNKYQHMLFGLVNRHVGSSLDIEDVVQKIFSKVYFALNKFDNKRPFFPWLYRIALNQCYDELRKVRRQKTQTFSELDLGSDDRVESLLARSSEAKDSPEDQKYLLSLLYQLLDRLPKKQRTALVLRDLEETPYEKVAEILNCSDQAARLKVFRARAKLRDLMLKSLRRREIRSVTSVPAAYRGAIEPQPAT